MSRNPARRERARSLRKEMPPAEGILWKHLRGCRFAGFKFRRQYEELESVLEAIYQACERRK
jgi:very-short-patch-repair endonuclease